MSVNEVARLPVPERLDPKSTARSLGASVRGYFFPLYNAPDGTFRGWLASVGNDDAVTGNRLFDRHNAVTAIKETAEKARDSLTASARDGDVYKHVVNIMRNHGMGLRLRRREYQRLTHQSTPAE